MQAAIYTLGCKVNQYETQAMEQELVRRGHTLVPFDQKADVYIVNTCSVTAVSDKKSRQMIRRAKGRNPGAVVAACGCYVQTHTDEAKTLGIDLIGGTGDRMAFLDLLEQRPLDKISVVDIADHCGVNRNTFYYYYCDIYALVREVLETELDRVLNAPPLCTSWYQLMMRVTAFMRANRRAVYHLYQSSQRDLLEREYYQVVYGAVEDLVRRTAEDLPVAETDVQSIAALYTATLVGLLQSWLHYGMKHDEEQFVERVTRLTEGTLRHALERSCGVEKA